MHTIVTVQHMTEIWPAASRTVIKLTWYAAAPAGVMIGRAALGRPWLFSETAAMLSGQWPDTPPPVLGDVLQIALTHLQSWVQWEQDEL